MFVRDSEETTVFGESGETAVRNDICLFLFISQIMLMRHWKSNNIKITSTKKFAI